jgi:glycosyltransferase involved in cell wall biosynthesis
MRIGVDLTFFTGTRGGMETYVRDLYCGMAQTHPEADLVAITTAVSKEAVAAWFPGSVHLTRFGDHSAPGWAIAVTLSVAPLAHALAVDLLHCPANLAPTRSRVPTVLTLHDVNAFAVASSASVTAAMTRLLVRRSFLAADAVITDSEWSAGEIRRLLPSTNAPLTVIPPVGPLPAPASTTSDDGPRPDALGAADLNRPFLLAGGNRLPHKNWEGLLHALAHIPSNERPLLVVTGDGGTNDPLAGQRDTLGLQRDVVLTGWTSSADLQWLYRTAALYVLPSRYEGFGLGVLEAMARGCPVLASDIPVLQEVGGEAVAYVDSLDPRLMAGAITALIQDQHRRERMSRAGERRAAEFPASATVARTWDVFLGVAARLGS